MHHKHIESTCLAIDSFPKSIDAEKGPGSTWIRLAAWKQLEVWVLEEFFSVFGYLEVCNALRWLYMKSPPPPSWGAAAPRSSSLPAISSRYLYLDRSCCSWTDPGWLQRLWLPLPPAFPSESRRSWRLVNQPAFSSFYSSSYSFSLLHFSPVLIGPSGLNLLTLGHQNLRAHFWWCGSGSSISADLGSTLSTTGLRFNFVPQVILRGMYGEACLGSQNGQLELIFSNSVIFFYIQEDYTWS